MAGRTGELPSRTLRGFGLCLFALLLPRTMLMSLVTATAADPDLYTTAYFPFTRTPSPV